MPVLASEISRHITRLPDDSKISDRECGSSPLEALPPGHRRHAEGLAEMMPQRFRRAESGEKRDAFDRLIGRLQQALRERQAFAEQPAADRRVLPVLGESAVAGQSGAGQK